MTESRRFDYLLLSVLILGMELRLPGLGFGLPFLYDADEPIYVSGTFTMMSEKTLNPGFFGHPGTFTIYTLALLFGIVGGIGLISGVYDSTEAWKAAVKFDPSLYYLIGRAWILCFALLTIFSLYHLALRFAGRSCALLATLLFACAPLAVHLSRLIRPDMQMTFLLVWIIYFSVSIVENGRWRDYLASGALLGLAVTAKYPAVVAALPIIVAHFLQQQRAGRAWTDHFARLIACGLFTLLVTFLASPFLFLDFATVLKHVASEARSTHLSHTSPGFFYALGWYVFSVMGKNFSLPGLLLVPVGIAALLKEKPAGPGWVLVSFVLGFLLFISSLSLLWERWALPLTPFVAILVAMGAFKLCEFGRGVAWIGRHKRPVAFFAVAILLQRPLMASIGETEALISGDTRTVAGRWIIDNVPQGASILVDRYTTQLPNGRYRVFEVRRGELAPLEGPKKYLNLRGGAIGDVRDVTTIDTDYVVMGEDYDKRLAEASRYANSLIPYQYVFKCYQLAYEIQAQPERLAGPAVRVYRRAAKNAGSVDSRSVPWCQFP